MRLLKEGQTESSSVFLKYKMYNKLKKAL